MKHLLLSLSLCLALFSGASAQITTEKGSKSDLINIKIHEIDLLLQILPLLLTKDQINHDVLPAVELARSYAIKQLKTEDDALAKMEPALDAALAAAYEKGAYPSKAVINEVVTTTKSASGHRIITQLNMVTVLTEMLKKTLNVGQVKALVNSFDPGFIDPKVKPETLSEEAKMNFFVKRVFMDPLAYEVLKKLGKG